MSANDGMWSGLARAAKWRWNLLGVGAGLAFAVLSGPALMPALAIVGAAELAYLGFLGLNPRFQAALKGGEPGKSPAAEPGMARYQQMVAFLSQDDRTRFESLRRRCAALLNLRRTMEPKDGLPGSAYGGGALDQMLWLFLKLLHQKAGLDRFLASTGRERIEEELARSEAQLQDAVARGGGDSGSRLATTIRERSQTIRDRLENHAKATENHELVCAEIDKTEQQINQLCEVGMTLRDTTDLTAQINTVSSSLRLSEKVLAETAVGGALDDDLAPPPLTGMSAEPPPIPRRRVPE